MVLDLTRFRTQTRIQKKTTVLSWAKWSVSEHSVLDLLILEGIPRELSGRATLPRNWTAPSRWKQMANSGTPASNRGLSQFLWFQLGAAKWPWCIQPNAPEAWCQRSSCRHEDTWDTLETLIPGTSQRSWIPYLTFRTSVAAKEQSELRMLLISKAK